MFMTNFNENYVILLYKNNFSIYLVIWIHFNNLKLGKML